MKLIFLHIPKAGGTTFHDILSRYYKKEETFDIVVVDKKLTIKEFTDLPAEKKKTINLLKGHMHFGLHTYFEDADVTYVTFLRNPVDRIVSQYTYILRRPNHYLYDKIVGNKMSFEEYALSDLSDEIDNGQVRLISGEQHIPMNAVTEEILNKAKENLRKHFIAVGIMEKFDESLLLCKQRFNWPAYPFYQRLNVSEKKGKDKMSDELRKAIEKRNSLDMELYRWASENFEKDIAAIPDLKNELQILKNQCVGFQGGYAEGYAEGQNKGFNFGYDYVMNKFFILKFARKVKKMFS